MDIIKHLRELRARATQGAWFLCEPSSVEYGRSVADTRAWIADSREARARTQVRCREGILPDPIADAALLVAAVNHLDLLLDVADAAEANYEVRHKPMTSLSDVSKRFDLLDKKAATWVALDSAVRALREARVK